ncbi:MAG: TIM barrel protein [bacterium]
MILSVSTRWNAHRHSSGEAMIGEIIDLGCRNVELGYDLHVRLLEGVSKMTQSGDVSITSAHAYCPLPPTAPYASPELFTLADPSRAVRSLAIRHLGDTIMLASEMGIPIVVTHAGNVQMRHLSRDLMTLACKGQQFTPKYDSIKDRLLAERQRKAPPQIQHLYESIEQLMPVLQQANVTLALENLPTWESIPTESEMEKLLCHFNSPFLKYWHDIGHAQIRENLGFIGHVVWLEKLQPFLAGMHVHDVLKPAHDHLMPPAGSIDFKVFRPFVSSPIPTVLEPYPDSTPDDVRGALKALAVLWDTGRTSATGGT